MICIPPFHVSYEPQSIARFEMSTGNLNGHAATNGHYTTFLLHAFIVPKIQINFIIVQ